MAETVPFRGRRAARDPKQEEPDRAASDLQLMLWAVRKIGDIDRAEQAFYAVRRVLQEQREARS